MTGDEIAEHEELLRLRGERAAVVTYLRRLAREARFWDRAEATEALDGAAEDIEEGRHSWKAEG